MVFVGKVGQSVTRCHGISKLYSLGSVAPPYSQTLPKSVARSLSQANRWGMPVPLATAHAPQGLDSFLCMSSAAKMARELRQEELQHHTCI